MAVQIRVLKAVSIGMGGTIYSIVKFCVVFARLALAGHNQHEMQNLELRDSIQGFEWQGYCDPHASSNAQERLFQYNFKYAAIISTHAVAWDGGPIGSVPIGLE